MSIVNISEGRFKLWEKSDSKERELEWLKVLENLGKINSVSKQLVEQHKLLFFDGIYETYSFRQKKYGSTFNAYKAGGGLFYAMWYHPQPTIVDYKQFLRCFGGREARKAKLFLFGQNPGFFLTPYGLCGGREELMVKEFYDGYMQGGGVHLTDEVGINYYKDSVFYPGFFCEATLQFCFLHSLNMLNNPGKSSPWAPGQYLWSYVDFMFDYEWEGLDPGVQNQALSNLAKVVNAVRDFDSCGVNHDSVIKLHSYLVSRFESGGFCETVQHVWSQFGE